jgi:pimeloyl-ACP methyl ester carboxylesterase
MEVHNRTWVARDGTRIAYTVAGSGPALVLTNGLTTSTLFWKYVLPAWQRAHTVITWDLPGHGRSSPAQTPATARVEAQPAIVRDIMTAAGVERAVQVGWSTGCQLVLEIYRQCPERCAGLALLLGPAGRVLSTTRFPLPGPLFGSLVRALPPRAFASFCTLISRAVVAPGSIALGRALQLIGPQTAAADMREVLAHIGLVDPGTLREMLLSLQGHSGFEVLPTVRVPLLIASGDVDPFAPTKSVGLPMHEAAPTSELLRLPNGTHTALLDDVSSITRAVEALARRAFEQ